MINSSLPIALILIFQLLSSCHSHCDEVERIGKLGIEGKIKRKYRLEWNHNSPELDFSNRANNVNRIYLVDEKSGFWEYINVGDSIVKKPKSFNVTVFRNKVLVKKFNLDYGCPK